MDISEVGIDGNNHNSLIPKFEALLLYKKLVIQFTLLVIELTLI